MALGRGWVGRIPNIETQGGPGSFEGGAGAQLFVECAGTGGGLSGEGGQYQRERGLDRDQGRLWDALLGARLSAQYTCLWQGFSYQYHIHTCLLV